MPPDTNPNYQPTAFNRPPKSGPHVLLVVAIFLTVATLALGVTSVYFITKYSQASNFLEEQKAEAATAARIEQQQADEAAFTAQLNNPYRSYTSPQIIAAFTLAFPKSWNLYAEEDSSAAEPLNLFINPEMVSAEKTYQGAYALRVKVEKKLYTEVVKGHQDEVEDGKLTAEPIMVSAISGTRYAGLVTEDDQGVLVILPIRDRTLSLWTENNDFAADFETIISQLQVTP